MFYVMGADGGRLIGPMNGHEAALLALDLDHNGEAVNIVAQNDHRVDDFLTNGGRLQSLADYAKEDDAMSFWLDRMPT